MVEVKTSELIGAALDWAVAKVEYQNTRIYASPIDNEPRIATNFQIEWRPSISWSQGGPLIEKYGIWTAPDGGGYWYAMIDGCAHDGGDTPLIAACRAMVAAKLGDTVLVPSELL